MLMFFDYRLWNKMESPFLYLNYYSRKGKTVKLLCNKNIIGLPNIREVN